MSTHTHTHTHSNIHIILYKRGGTYNKFHAYINITGDGAKRLGSVTTRHTRVFVYIRTDVLSIRALHTEYIRYSYA